MFHPKDVRGRMSRRALLERGAGFAVAGSLLAACANSTDVKSSAGAGTSQAGEVVTQGTSTAAAVPLGPGGIPIATRDRPVKLPTYNLAPIDSNLPLEDGPLKVYNWDQYIDPEIVKKFEKQFKKKVTITTYQNEDEAMAKL